MKLFCSPRFQNILDHVTAQIDGSYVEPMLARQFRELTEPAQVGDLDIGQGLCGRRGRRLARSRATLTCPDCLALLYPLAGTECGT